MFRFDENYVQPENGNPGYVDPEAAAAQRERWAAAAADLANTIDLKPQPSDTEYTSDQSRSSQSFRASCANADAPRATEDAEPANPPPASRDVRTAPSVPWPFISLMANAVLFTAL
eukprot:648144-Pleurochrysis_carterae.AAC.1